MTETLKQFQQKYGIRVGIVLLSMLFLCTFISRKEGYHMDEVLAFQLANAEYNPWIVPTQPVGRLAKFMAEYVDGESLGDTWSNMTFIFKDTLTNRGNSILANYKADVYEAPVWMSRDTFQHYVQCTTEDDFNLVSVYFNVKDDNHPPLHFMLLHLMSSLLKGDMNPWTGCVINLVAVAGVLWLLGSIGDLLFQSRYSTYACMALYGFSVGAVATTIWIRMYALLTLWTVWSLYLHLHKYVGAAGDSFDCRIRKKNGKAKWLGSVGIFLVTVASFWTQYFGLFFMLPLALVTVVLLAKEQRREELWAYMRTMITAAVVGVCGYPFAIGDVLFSSRGTEALSQWGNGLADYLERLASFGSILAQNLAGSTVLLLLLIAVPAAVLWLYRQTWEIKWCLCGIPAVVYFLLAAKMSPYYVDRYIMAIFPVAAVLLIGLWDACICVKSKKWSVIIMAVAVLTTGVSAVRYQGQHTYLYTGYAEQVEVAKAYREYPMVCLYPGLSFYENVMEMEQYRETILLREEELASMSEEQIQVAAEGYVALIKFPQEHSGAAQLQRVMNVFGGSKAQLLYEGGAFGDAVYLVTP